LKSALWRENMVMRTTGRKRWVEGLEILKKEIFEI
jgi:hypothetical protein